MLPTGYFRGILPIIATLVLVTPRSLGWSPSPLLSPRAARMGQAPPPTPRRGVLRSIVGISRTYERDGRTPALRFIKYMDPVEDPDRPPPIALTPDQDAALRSDAPGLQGSYGDSWFELPEAWDEFRRNRPSMAEYDDEELLRAYVTQKPTPADLLIKTPLGPLLVINAILYASGFSWCDTPFQFQGACPI